MRLIPHSFNGFYFQQKNRVVGGWSVPYDWTIAGVSTSAIARSQNFPSYAVKNYAGGLKFIKVTFNSIDTDRDSLVIAMDILGEDQHQLIALDELGRAWYLNAVCLGMTEEAIDENTASFNVVFDTDDPIWKKLIPSTKTISMFYGTGNETMTPLGNQPALPIITITPGEGTSSYGFSFKRFVQISNNSVNALTNYPLNLTGAGLDTATLVGAGKMLANGDDLRIYVDGVEVKRWFGGGGINSATTKIWINWTQPAKSDMTLGADILITGDVSTITIEATAANIALLSVIPSSGRVKIESEIFVYTGVDVASRTLTGCTRAERETSAEAHSIGDAVIFITHDVWMYYGNPSVAPYIVDDAYKPIINLVDSANDSHVYDEFGANEGTRTGAWTKTPGIVNSPYGTTNGYLYGVYTGIAGGVTSASVNPWEVAGIRGATNWNLYNPCGLDWIKIEGQKFFNGPGVGGAVWAKDIQTSLDGTAYTHLWSETTPTPLSTWVSLDAHDQAISAPYPFYIRVTGFTNPGGIGGCFWHAADVTAGVGNPPSIVVSAENTTNINVFSVFTNAATGHIMTVNLSLNPGLVLIINTKEKTVKLQDGSNQINALIDMPVRSEWFPLLPAQANVVTITEAANVDFAFSYEDRSM